MKYKPKKNNIKKLRIYLSKLRNGERTTRAK